MSENALTAVAALVGVFGGVVWGWIGRGIYDTPDLKELDRLADELTAVTRRTMAKRQAHAEASRKGWATRNGKKTAKAGRAA